MWAQSLGQEDPQKKMATHPRILAWEIPSTEKPGRLVHEVARVGNDLMTKPPPPPKRVSITAWWGSGGGKVRLSDKVAFEQTPEAREGIKKRLWKDCQGHCKGLDAEAYLWLSGNTQANVADSERAEW